MNDLNAILAQIGKEATEYREKTLEAARRDAQCIEAEFTAQAKAEGEKVIEAAKAQALAIEQRAHSQAGLAARNASLSVRRKVVDEAFTKSLEQLRQLPDSRLIDFYASQAEKCIEKDAVLVLNEHDKAAFGAQLAERISELSGRRVELSEKCGSFIGGFVLREGSIETNYTFEVLNMRAKEELEAEVAAILFS